MSPDRVVRKGRPGSAESWEVGSYEQARAFERRGKTVEVAVAARATVKKQERKRPSGLHLSPLPPGESYGFGASRARPDFDGPHCGCKRGQAGAPREPVRVAE